MTEYKQLRQQALVMVIIMTVGPLMGLVTFIALWVLA